MGHAEKWDPTGLTLELDESDLQVGSRYQITMIGGEKGRYINNGIYKEIIPNEKLVFTHGWEGPDRVDTRVTVEFRDKNQGTELILSQAGFKDPKEVTSHEEVPGSSCLYKNKGLK